jgi:hypothetical protein
MSHRGLAARSLPDRREPFDGERALAKVSVVYDSPHRSITKGAGFADFPAGLPAYPGRDPTFPASLWQRP